MRLKAKIGRISPKYLFNAEGHEMNTTPKKTGNIWGEIYLMLADNMRKSHKGIGVGNGMFVSD